MGVAAHDVEIERSRALAINVLLGSCMIITSFSYSIVVSRKKDHPVLQC
jgi:hypothetical protein